MYAAYIVKRTQIYLDEDQDHALSEQARARGRMKSTLIREAIDGYLAPVDARDAELRRFRAAVRDASGSATYLERGADYVETIQADDRRRELDLERRRAG